MFSTVMSLIQGFTESDSFILVDESSYRAFNAFKAILAALVFASCFIGVFSHPHVKKPSKNFKNLEKSSEKALSEDIEKESHRND